MAYKFKTKIVARYAETDQMGVVHHSVYPIWYEVARTEFIKHIGISYSQMEKMGVMTPLAHLQCDYKNATKYEDEVTIFVWISKLTPARIEFSYEMYKSSDNIFEKPINTGKTLHGFTDTLLKPLNMKKNYPDIFQNMLKLTY